MVHQVSTIAGGLSVTPKMSTCTPISVSVPYSSLISSSLDRQPSSDRPDIDDLLDELDNESDSGYDDVSPSASPDKKESNEKRDNPESARDDKSAKNCRSSPSFRPLVDRPNVYPSSSGLNGFSYEDHHNGDGSVQVSTPSWTKWTSSRVTCMDTAFATNEDKLECIWLVAGCEDGTIWIFCSMTAVNTVTTSSSSEQANSIPIKRGHSNTLHSQLRTSLERPEIKRHSSDIAVSRKTHHGQPSSPGSAVSRNGAPSTYTSFKGTHARHHRSSHSGSISLAVHGTNTPGSHAGSHTPIGRKASATVSLAGTDALGRDAQATGLEEQLAKSRSTPFTSDLANTSHEALQSADTVDFQKIDFKPVAHVYLKASRSPILSLHMLPAEAAATPFVCLTRSGQLYKLAVRDGVALQMVDIASQIVPRTSSLNLRQCQMVGDAESACLLIESPSNGITVPVLLHDLSVCG